MSLSKSLDIYWANSFFSEADRSFNNAHVKRLRSLGYSVYSPQEESVNVPDFRKTPSAEEIFFIDTIKLMESRILVACIDQESIDSGVACEIGIASAIGIPIIGYYTDIRQFREGQGRMYKNLYVAGSIDVAGAMVHDDEELMGAVRSYLTPASSEGDVELNRKAVSHFNSIASMYEQYVDRLEALYQPPWTAKQTMLALVEKFGGSHILEFGSGTGHLGRFICSSLKNASYVGLDEASEMVQIANKKRLADQMSFATSWDDIPEESRIGGFDVVYCAFSLHDIQDQVAVVSNLATALANNGHLIILDLTKQDLPAITEILLRSAGLAVLDKDRRLDSATMVRIAQDAGLKLTQLEHALPQVVFPTLGDVDEYLRTFGIYDGLDIPALRSGDNPVQFRERVLATLEDCSFPFVDQRVFGICVMEKSID